MQLRFFLFLSVLSLFACTPKMADAENTVTDTNDAVGPAKSVAYGERAELAVGEGLRVPRSKAAFTFTKVVTDSRCPTNMNCVQAGEAVLLMTLPDGSTRTVKVPAKSRQPVTFGISEGNVTVIAFNPYPDAMEKTPMAAYRLVVKVDEAISQ